MRIRRLLLVLSASLALLALGSGCSSPVKAETSVTSTSTTASPYGTGSGKPSSSPVLDKQSLTVLEQVLAYPGVSQAQVTASVLTFEPGARTGLHRHEAPLFVYVLEGTITVTYDGGVVKEFTAGQGMLEAIGTTHEGENRTAGVVKLLAVNLGAEGVANTVSL